jgi:hypothetical protein
MCYMFIFPENGIFMIVLFRYMCNELNINILNIDAFKRKS